MTAEFYSKLRSRTLNGTHQPTPNQISQYLEKEQSYANLRIEIEADLPQQVLQKFLAKNGGSMGEG